jgi:uncharacterized protein
MKALHVTAFILLVIGGLNWLLVGINSGWNVVDNLFGAGSTLSKIVYILVGLSTLVVIFTHKKTCRMCEKNSTVSSAPQM